jgi:ring-1,2-phenylacetyl-CoA epoxidase subunit PaaD
VVKSVERVARPRPAGEIELAIWNLAATVVDPEVPVVTIEDLGVLRHVELTEDGGVVVQLTPTYSGCPAIDAMRDDVVSVVTASGYSDVRVEVVLAPAWTTDWISQAGRDKLEANGIAPPAARRADGQVNLGLGVRCPRCQSLHTRQTSRFGSTACKALFVCQRCQEPFDHFKEH